METAQAYRLLAKLYPSIRVTNAIIDYDGVGYIQWEAEEGTIALEGDFMPEALEALATWMKAHQIAPPESGPAA